MRFMQDVAPTEVRNADCFALQLDPREHTKGTLDNFRKQRRYCEFVCSWSICATGLWDGPGPCRTLEDRAGECIVRIVDQIPVVRLIYQDIAGCR
jgi:hypothetical protein